VALVLRQDAVFPAGNRLDGDAELFGKFPLVQAQPFAVVADLLGRKEPKVLSQGTGDLLVGMVVENQLSTGGAPGHAEPGHFDGERPDLRITWLQRAIATAIMATVALRAEPTAAAFACRCSPLPAERSMIRPASNLKGVCYV
jgi:hypothetical protein